MKAAVMQRFGMRRLLRVALGACGVMACGAAGVALATAADSASPTPAYAAVEPRGETLTLERAVKKAVERARRESGQVQLAQARLAWLEANSKRQFTLRPQLNLLSFSNPGLLAASAGMGLLLGERPLASKWDVLQGKFDVLEAEMDEESRLRRAGAEAAEAFLGLSAAQAQTESVCGAWVRMHGERERAIARMQAGQLLALHLVTFETEMVSREERCVWARSELGAARERLARRVGGDEVVNTAAAHPEADAMLEYDILPQAALLERALRSHPGRQKFRQRLEELLADTSAQAPWLELDQVTPGYAAIRNGGSWAAQSGTALLGGHAPRLDLGFRVNLRKSAETEMRKQWVTTRVLAAEQSLTLLEEDLRMRVAAARRALVDAQERLRLARKKAALAHQALAMQQARLQAGLARQEDVSHLERQAMEAETGSATALAAWRAGFSALLVACGVEENARNAELGALFRVKAGTLQADGKEAGAGSRAGEAWLTVRVPKAE
jgi:hypothetical protein